MPTFTFNCENADDENGCEHETEIEVTVSGGEQQTWEHPGSAPDIEYEMPEKCEGCGVEFTQAHKDHIAKEIDENAEERAQQDYDDGRDAAYEDEYDRRRDDGDRDCDYWRG